MMFINDAQRRAVFASFGRNSFSFKPTVNFFAVDKKKNIERLIKRLAPRIRDDFDPQTFDFWAEYDDDLSFEQNAEIIARKLASVGALQGDQIDTTEIREHEVNELMNAVATRGGEIDFNALVSKLEKDKGLRNLFRDRLAAAVYADIIKDDDYIVMQLADIDDTFARKLSKIRKVKESNLKSVIDEQLREAENRRAVAAAALPSELKDEPKEKRMSDAIESAVTGRPLDEVPSPGDKDYIKKLVDATFKKKEPVNDSQIVVEFRPMEIETYETY
jgi:hypothetical protein